MLKRSSAQDTNCGTLGGTLGLVGTLHTLIVTNLCHAESILVSPRLKIDASGDLTVLERQVSTLSFGTCIRPRDDRKNDQRNYSG